MSPRQPAQRPLRVAAPPYLVARPLTEGLEREPLVQFEREVPSRLVERLRGGELDVALVSSIELFRQQGYAYLAGYAIAGHGEVASVRVFLRRPLEEVASIALDPASRAAAALVQTLCSGALGDEFSRPRVAPRFVETPAGSDPARAEADAWLEIGDAALKRSLSQPHLEYFDPSGAWARATQLPFPFATWIVRPGVELTHAELAAFARARAAGLARLEDYVEEGATSLHLPREALRRYLRLECRFDDEPRLDLALERWRAAATKAGMCQGYWPARVATGASSDDGGACRAS